MDSRLGGRHLTHWIDAFFGLKHGHKITVSGHRELGTGQQIVRPPTFLCTIEAELVARDIHGFALLHSLHALDAPGARSGDPGNGKCKA